MKMAKKLSLRLTMFFQLNMYKYLISCVIAISVNIVMKVKRPTNIAPSQTGIGRGEKQKFVKYDMRDAKQPAILM